MYRCIDICRRSLEIIGIYKQIMDKNINSAHNKINTDIRRHPQSNISEKVNKELVKHLVSVAIASRTNEQNTQHSLRM